MSLERDCWWILRPFFDPSYRTEVSHLPSSLSPPITPDVQPSVMSEAPDTPPSTSLPYLSHSRESVFAAPIKRSLSESDEGEASYVPGDTTIQTLSEQQFVKVASPYIASYVLHAANVGKEYGMRRD